MSFFIGTIWRNVSLQSLAHQWILWSEWQQLRMRVQTADKNISIIHTTTVHQLTSWEVKSCIFAMNKSIKIFESIHFFFYSDKVALSESGEKYAQIKHRLKSNTVLNKYVTLQEVNWTRDMWITCRLLWFVIFLDSHCILSKWWNCTFLQVGFCIFTFWVNDSYKPLSCRYRAEVLFTEKCLYCKSETRVIKVTVKLFLNNTDLYNYFLSKHFSYHYMAKTQCKRLHRVNIQQ